MKSASVFFAGIALAAAVVATTLWLELRAEQQVTADLRAQLVEARARPSAAMVAAVEPRVEQPAIAAAPAITESKPPPVPAAAPGAPAAFPASVQDSLNRERELMRDPEYRKARVAQQRASIQRTYPGLVEALGLSDTEAARLFDLLAEHQVNISTEITLVAASSTPDQAAMQEQARRQMAMQQQQEDAVRAMLGDARYAQWQDYQQTRAPRMQATNMGAQLAQAGHPLSDAQQRALTATLISEQRRQRQESQNMAQRFTSADPQARAQMMEESMRRQEEMQRRVLEAASSSLSSQQIAVLRQQYEAQTAMNRASMRLEQARMEAQGGAGTATAGGVSLPIFIGP